MKIRLLILITFCTSVIFADGTQPPGFGTSEAPYQVSTLDHLLWISTNSSSWGSYFEQTANIDASATSTWNPDGSGGYYGFSPIGNEIVNFTGSYDGKSYYIDNIYIDRYGISINNALFGYTSYATISNLTVNNVDITGSDMNTGALIAFNSHSSVSYCSSSGNIVGSNYDTGGLIGYNSYSNVNNCHSSATVWGTFLYVGGLIGHDSSSTVIACSASGDVEGVSYVGGLIGAASNWNNVNPSNIINCFSTGKVTANYGGGGLLGRIEHSSCVKNSFSEADVVGKMSGSDSPKYLGGLVGFIATSAAITDCYATGTVTGIDYIGGFVGGEPWFTSLSATINNSFSIGPVTGVSNVGGFSGGSISVLSNCFYNSQTSGQSDTGKGTPKTTAEMKTLATFTDVSTAGLTTAWDFVSNPNDDAANNDYWDMDLSGSINDGYPYLSWQDGGDVSLSVGLVSFSASCYQNSVVLQWITESEVDHQGFIVKRSADRTIWETISSYETNPELRGKGNTSVRTEYSFVDEDVDLGCQYFYRLSDVDMKGVVTTHSVLAVQIENLPEMTKMENAYPNPFNPETFIAYQLDAASEVEISVFDMLGRKIRTLINEHQEAGKYHVYWNAKNQNSVTVPSGQYVIQMRTPEIAQIQKVLFLK